MPRPPARKKLQAPDAAVLAYRAGLRRRVEAIKARALPMILDAWAVRQDAGDSVKQLGEGLEVIVSQELAPSRTRALVETIARRVANKGKTQLSKVVPVGIRTEKGIPAAINAFRVQNTNLISSLGQKEVREKLIPLLEQAELSGLRVENLRTQLIEAFDVTKSKAELLARDQTLKLNGQLNGLRQTNSGITQYTWSTSNDERVRPYHKDLDSTVQTWGDPPVVSEDGRREEPGLDFQCRCVAIPVIPDYSELPDLTEE